MKRVSTKRIIERYYYMLTDGCGNPNCDNDNCVSSGKVGRLSQFEYLEKVFLEYVSRMFLMFE